MKNDGKPLEKTIQLIEETFKDSEHTEVFRNYKIKSKTGDKREIDILVKTIISGYDIWIAIECKDYESKVSVEKIDAFSSKCNVITEINRKIFISKNGFQKGAINHAKEYGIELMTAEELDNENLKSIPPIHNLVTKVLPEYGNRHITLDENFKHLYENIDFTFRGIIINTTNNQKINIDDLFSNNLREYQHQIQNLALIQWMRLDKAEKSKDEKTIIVKLELLFEHFAIENIQGNRIPLIKGTCDVEINLKKIYPTKISSRLIKYSDNTIKAQSINIKLDDKTESEVIIKPNEEFDFYVSENNSFIKLEKLGVYNPNTNLYTKE